MKRLFEVNGVYFDSKVDAKVARDAGPAGSKVSKGPDHMGNHGLRVRATRHRAPQGGFAPKPRSM